MSYNSVMAKYGSMVDSAYVLAGIDSWFLTHGLPILDSRVVIARIAIETNGNANAVSSNGEKGLLQLFPWAIEAYGVSNPFDPLDNIIGGLKMWSHSHIASVFVNKSQNVQGWSNLDWQTAYWSTTAVGSGATDKLLRDNGTIIKASTRELEYFERLGVAGWLGGQSPSTVRRRLAVACEHVALAIGQDDLTHMELGAFIVVIAATATIALYRIV